VQRRVKQTQQGYLGKRIGPMLGDRPIGSVTVEVLDVCDAELCRCRDHCDGQPQGPRLDPSGTSHVETAQAESAANRDLVTLELVHLGTSARRMRTQANTDGLDALQPLTLDATRRAGGSWSRIGESAMNVRLAGSAAETLATGVVAA
jgi:hypothetical protein